MQPDPLPDAPLKSFVHLVGHGLVYGAIAGIVSAEIYIVGITVVAFIASGDPSELLVTIFGQIFGALPAVVTGAFNGAIMGASFFFLHERLSARAGRSWGLLISAPIAVPLALLFTIPITAPGLILGLPIVVLYFASGAWVGNKLAGGTFRISSAQRKVLLVVLGVVGVLVLGRAAVAVVFSDH